MEREIIPLLFYLSGETIPFDQYSLNLGRDRWDENRLNKNHQITGGYKLCKTLNDSEIPSTSYMKYHIMESNFFF